MADILITSPPSAFTKGEYSLSGSTIIISASGSLNLIDVISCFAVKDLPLPLTVD